METSAADDASAVRALLFDLGGVVLDVDFGPIFGAWAAQASRDPAALAGRFAFDEAYEQFERGELDPAGYFAALRSSLGLPLPDADFAAGWSGLSLAPVTGMIELLAAAARRFPLYAFTNSNPPHQRIWTARFGAELSIFRSVFVSSELGMRKPDPAAFMTVARKAGFPPAEILFFDDTAANVAGAQAAGMQAVLVRSTRDVRQALLRLGVETETGPAG